MKPRRVTSADTRARRELIARIPLFEVLPSRELDRICAELDERGLAAELQPIAPPKASQRLEIATRSDQQNAAGLQDLLRVAP